jgi:two-component system nitrate/nitrite sensor histidine kinase NarX
MLSSIQGRMGAIFIAFAALVTVAVAVSTWIIETQAQDALIINMAGRQRMLLQQMTKNTLEIEKNRQTIALHRQAAQEAALTFDQTLRALLQGGTAPYSPQQAVVIPATHNPAIVNTLTQLSQNWLAYQHNLDTVLTSPPGSADFSNAIQSLDSVSPDLVQQADVVVRLFENDSAQKVSRLRQVQLVFFASAIILLAIGVWVTQKSVVEPLNQLGLAARRIGDGDMRTPVAANGPVEILHLSENFNIMRRRLRASQEQLEAQVQQRTRELANAFEFSQEIVTELELERLLTSVTSRAKHLLNARVASVCLLTPSGSDLVLQASSDPPLPANGIVPEANPLPISLQVVGQGDTVVAEAGCTNCQFLQGYAPGQCMATPLRTGERTLGALCVVRAENQQFDAAETRALTLLANSAATAITNAHLIEAEQQQARETASLAERERLAAELHDNLAQTLSFLNLKTDNLKEMVDTGHTTNAQTELSWMKSAIGAAYGQVRAALVGLREPVDGGDNDLSAKLKATVDDLQRALPATVKLLVLDNSALALADVVQKQALHIVRESLNNARRHAHAQHIEVRVERENGHACFTIHDDGQGFNPAHLSGGNHYGLTIMRARAERVGGSLIIESAPNAGTTVIARLPLESGGQVTRSP